MKRVVYAPVSISAEPVEPHGMTLYSNDPLRTLQKSAFGRLSSH